MMNLSIQLLRIFLSAGILFGGLFALLLGVLINWRVGAVYGIASGLLFWVGVSGVMLILSILRNRSRHGSNGEERLNPGSSH